MKEAVQKIVDYRIQQARAEALGAERETALSNTLHHAQEMSSLIKSKTSPLAKKAASLALKHRKKIEEGDLSVFQVAFTVALGKDGCLDFIPILGFFFGLPATIYLFIFLWGRGTWKWKIFRTFLLFFDLFTPFIKIIPITTFCVWITYHHAQQNAEKAKIELKKLGIPT